MFQKISLAMLVVAFVTSPLIVSAHQREIYNIGGTDYLLVIGSLNEPVVVDDKSGLDLRVMTPSLSDPTNASAPDAKPVVGLESALKVELIAGQKKKVQDITPAYGAPGSYKTLYYPTVQTTLSYRLFGTLNNTKVDLTFTCSPAGHVVAPEDKTALPISDGVKRTFKTGKFGCPEAKKDYGFPEEAMTNLDIHSDGEVHMIATMTEVDKKVTSGTSAPLAFSLIAVILGGIALFRARTPKM